MTAEQMRIINELMASVEAKAKSVTLSPSGERQFYIVLQTRIEDRLNTLGR